MIDSIVITGILILMTISSVGIGSSPFEDQLLVLIIKIAVFLAVIPFALSAFVEVANVIATKPIANPERTSLTLTAIGFLYLIIMASIFVVIHTIATFVVSD